MKPADAQFSGYRAKILLKLGFRAPNLEPPLSSRLQIICCKQFFQRSNFSVSAPYAGGRRPVIQLFSENTTQRWFDSTKLGACIQFNNANSLLQKIFLKIEMLCLCPLWCWPTPCFAIKGNCQLTPVGEHHTLRQH